MMIIINYAIKQASAQIDRKRNVKGFASAKTIC